MKIEILGTGCYQCIRLESLIVDVLIELEIQDADLTRVSEEQAIRRWMPLDALPGSLCAPLHPLDQAPWLAIAAEVGDPPSGSDLRDSGAAAGASLPATHVHGKEIARLEVDVLAHGLPHLLDGLEQRGAHGLVQRIGLGRGE